MLALIDQGDTQAASDVHLDEEHPTSHTLEALMGTLVTTAKEDMVVAQSDFRSAHDLLTGMVIAFSAVSVIVALLLGFVLSWAFILPVRKMERALADITAGNFAQRVEVPNRDEFGSLARDLNSTSERLATMFDDQRRLATRLGETNASLERASEAKSRFLANVSHELRTPMTAILGFTDAVLAGVDGPLNPEQETSLRWVQRGGQDLLGLINEILDLSKIEAGKLTLDIGPFDPRELLEAVVAQHRSLAAQKGIRFGWRDAGTPAEVVLDRQRVRQILVNLVGNALKFTESGEVEVVSARTDDARYHVDGSRHRAWDLPGAAGGDLRGVPPGGGSRARHRPRAADQPPPRTSDGRRRHVRERAQPREHLPPRPPARLSPDPRWQRRPSAAGGP